MNKLLNQKLIPNDQEYESEQDMETSIRSTEFDIRQLKASVQGHLPENETKTKYEEPPPATDRSAVTQKTVMNSVLKSMNQSNMQFYENLHKKYFNKAKENNKR